MSKINIYLSEFAGFCFGVKRAVDMAEERAKISSKNNGEIFSLGPIIHNPQVVDKLQENGIKVIENIGDITENSTVIIRTHGVHPDVEKSLNNKNLEVVDVTCPIVRKAQNYAKKLKEDGYDILLVGEHDHPEVKAILGYCGKNTLVVNSIEELNNKDITQKVGILAQTTQSISAFAEIVAYITTISKEIKVYNTICGATEKRQAASVKLAKVVDLMIIIGGRNSGNTRRLFELCCKVNDRTHHIETYEEIKVEWFNENIKSVGISAGASTPEWIIESVINKIKKIDTDDEVGSSEQQ